MQSFVSAKTRMLLIGFVVAVLLGRGGSVNNCFALENGLARTPPMGWNSWNLFACNVDEQLIRNIADAMVSSGMRDAGYIYVNIDDCWHGTRDANGNIQPNPVTFPSGMAALADYVHSLGLKLGIYSDAGTLTCAGYPGSKGYEQKDADQYAAWGIDYLKYDWCHTEGQDTQQSYTLMSDCLLNTGRPIVFSICCWEFPGEWVMDVGNLWRTTTDIWDSWGSVVLLIDTNADLHPYAGPGHWNDPDMLEVGNGGMTNTEYRAHFSMWCIMAAPLLAGNDLRNMSQATIDILTAPEVIAVDQDPLGIQGRRVRDYGDHEVWVKELVDEGRAVALFNRGSTAADITVNFSDLGEEFTNNNVVIRDLWQRQDVGTMTNSYTANVPSHGAVLIKASAIVPEGMLKFSQAAYSVAEEGGIATITVTRTGGSLGAVSVSYAANEGSAQVGADYIRTQGTLYWDDADSSGKTFIVTIIDNSHFEGNKALSLNLGNFTGGAVAGTPSSATLTIIDDDLPANAPQNLVITGVTYNSASLKWDCSGENISGYKVYRNSAEVATISTTNYTDFGLSQQTAYEYTTTAYYSGAGTESAHSSPVVATTSEYSPDTWNCTAVGSCMPGGYCSDDGTGTFTIVGSGADIWGAADAFQYMYQSVSDVEIEIVARVGSIENTNEWAKAGVMIRDTLNADSKHAMVIESPAHGARLQCRSTTGGSTSETAGSGIGPPRWVRLVRSGNTFNGYESANGSDWALIGSKTITMTDPVYVGLPVTSHDNSLLCTAIFDNVFVKSHPLELPTVPQNLTVIGVTETAVSLAWDASTDNTGIGGYKIFRNGLQTGTSVGTSYTDTNLDSHTGYTYTVSAYDSAMNDSNPGAPCEAFTDAAAGDCDLNGDGIVNLEDFGELARYWKLDELSVDIAPPSNIVNLEDLLVFAEDWLAYSTTPPAQATNPNPSDYATDVDINADLSFTAGACATSHDVYFGMTNPPPFMCNQTAATFDPGSMAQNSIYCWCVDELNGWGKTKGQVWTFTTMSPEGSVPNGDFELLYKPATGIPGSISSDGWTQGVGPGCPIDTGQYNFSDSSSGDHADIPGWLGYDRNGWIAWGGTYDRDETTGNLQGSVAYQGNHTPDGENCYLANGGGWSNPAGGLITSAAPLGNVLGDSTYTLSMYAQLSGGNAATPVVLNLLAGSVVVTPSSSASPTLTTSWQEFSRTYNSASLLSHIGEPLTIVLGVGRNAAGNQTKFDDVSLSHSPE